MATLTSTLTLSSTDVSSDTLSFSVTDGATVVAPIENVARITATTTGNASIIAPNTDAVRYIYIKHLGLNSAGGSSGADQIKVETADGTEIMRISKDEFAFFPHYAGGAGLIQLEASAGTVIAEYGYWTKG